MAWKFRSGISLCAQICDKLRSDILKGTYKPGSQFPTVRQLAYDAGVNPNTMQKSLTVLENEGLILAKSTSGRVVTDDPEILALAKNKALNTFTENLILEAKSMSLGADELIENIKKGWSLYE